MDTPPTRTLILIIEDHPLFRKGMAMALEEAGYQVIQADNARTGLELALQHEPKGAVVDFKIPNMPGDKKPDPMNGIHLGHQLKKKFPQMGVVFLSAHPEYARNLFGPLFDGRQGLAYQDKNNRVDQILNALSGAMQGDIIIEPSILRAPPNSVADIFIESLTPQEREWVIPAEKKMEMKALAPQEIIVAQKKAWSQTNHSIAEDLCIARSTVDTHIKNIYRKLELDSAELDKDNLLAKAVTLYKLLHQEAPEPRRDKGAAP